jgi:N-acetylmuramoyl-L-alanine amidase
MNESEEPEQPAGTREAHGCHASGFKVAIDVGHTVEAPGALSARGVDEHVFNLALAREIEK